MAGAAVKLRFPFFEIGLKNYFYGDEVLEIALAADRAAARYGVEVLLITPLLEIRRVAERTGRLLVIAPYVDLTPPGRGVGAVSAEALAAEALAAAGARGAALNHCERPMPLAAVGAAVRRLREAGLLSLVSADTISQGKSLAVFAPDIICPEPPELIGGVQAPDLRYVRDAVEEIKSVCPQAAVEAAGGITTPEQVYHYIKAGADGAGSASGICRADDPCAALDAMVRGVRLAMNEL